VIDATTQGWTLHRREGAFVVHQQPARPSSPGKGECWAIFGEGFARGEIIVPPSAEGGAFCYPLGAPFEYILLSGYLSLRRGLLLHGCAVADRGRALVFTGPSGSGKTTMARLWAGHTDAIVLNDDLVFLREIEGTIWVFGTPWGTNSADLSSPAGAPLGALFFLQPASSNEMQVMDTAPAVAQLFAQAFSPWFYDAAYATRILDLCTDICRSVPVRRLGFQRAAGTIRYLRAAV